MGWGLYVDKRFTHAKVLVNSNPIYNMEKVWVNEWRTLIINLKCKRYSLHTTIHSLPATFKLKNSIHFIQLLNQNLQRFSSGNFDFFILFHFINSPPIDLIKLVIWYWKEAFHFLLRTKVDFSTFYIELLFTSTVARVNVLSSLYRI